jgi:serine/threonine protein kinase
VDFGLSNTYEKYENLKTACGSPCYASPEMIKGLSYSGNIFYISINFNI